jgi:hypothetical protein
MLSTNELESYFSVPDLQLDTTTHDPMNQISYVEFSSSGGAQSPKAAPVQDAYTPVNNICPEVYTLLAAFEASASRRMNALDVDCMELAGDVPGVSLQIGMEGVHDPAYHDATTSMAPPRRYCRTFWRSISQRLLHK